MTEGEGSDRARQLAQVAGLAVSVADRIISAQIVGLQIPKQQIIALTRAARLLKDEGSEWPPLVEDALQAVADSMVTGANAEIGSERA